MTALDAFPTSAIPWFCDIQEPQFPEEPFQKLKFNFSLLMKALVPHLESTEMRHYTNYKSNIDEESEARVKLKGIM